MADIGLVSAVKIGVILRRHVSAAAPVLIAYPKIIHRPGLFMSVGLSQICHGRDAVKGHIFHPFRHFLYGAASHIPVNIGFAAQLLTQLKKLMGSEAVVLQDAAPVGIDHLFAVFFRADPVLPVVFIRKASPRPAQYRNPDFLKSLHHIRAHPVLIGNPGIFFYIQPLVNASSKMLRKVSVNFWVDMPLFLFFIYV